MKNSVCFRYLALWILGVSALSTSTVVLGQLAGSRRSKIVIYPSAHESISQMQQLGISHAINYGSYWLAEVTDDQLASVKARYGERVVKADSMNRIQLNVCEIDVNRGEPSNIPESLRESPPEGNRLRLVQFRGPVKPEWLKQLQTVGDIKIVSYVPNNAYVVWVDAAAESNLHRLKVSNGPVQWISAYHPFYKAKHSLLQTTNAEVDVTVELVDTPQLPQSLGVIRGLCHDGKCGEPIEIGGRIQIQATLPATALLSVVRLPDVLWVQQVVPMQRMDENQAIVLATGSNGSAPARYLDFLNAVGFPNDPYQYPILDIADTGLDEPNPSGRRLPVASLFLRPVVSRVSECAMRPVFYVARNVLHRFRYRRTRHDCRLRGGRLRLGAERDNQLLHPEQRCGDYHQHCGGCHQRYSRHNLCRCLEHSHPAIPGHDLPSPLFWIAAVRTGCFALWPHRLQSRRRPERLSRPAYGGLASLSKRSANQQ
jgi:hypothetical protein